MVSDSDCSDGAGDSAGEGGTRFGGDDGGAEDTLSRGKQRVERPKQLPVRVGRLTVRALIANARHQRLQTWSIRARCVQRTAGRARRPRSTTACASARHG